MRKIAMLLAAAVMATPLFVFGERSVQATGPLAQPQGDILLTVSGKIARSNGDAGTARFDFDSLQALGETEIRTSTIWTEGEHVFTGVPLSVLVDAVGVQGDTLHATAINEYSVSIPVSDASADGPILAYAMDGERLTRRTKGPLWVVYPYDSDAAYRTEVVYTRSIWQLDRIVVGE